MRRSMIAAALAVSVACGDEGPTSHAPDAAISRDGGGEDAGRGEPDAGGRDAAADGDAAAGGDGGRTSDAGDLVRDGGAPVDAGPPPDCPLRSEVIVYNQSAWGVLAAALAADASPCSELWLSIPALAGDKTMPRAGGQAAAIRARGARFHAAAEFHWGGWRAAPGSWYDKGVEFRRRMEAAGYDVAAGDTWAINELPSTTRSEATVRQNVRDAVRGLHDGPPGAPPLPGIVFVIGMGQATTNFSVYKPNLETWLSDEAFWTAMDRHVRFWGQEVYAEPAHTCVASATTGLQSARLNEFTMHAPRLAVAGPAAVATARTYLRRAYVPVMNAVWQSDVYRTHIPLTPMKHFVSQQVYSARAWAGSHLYPDGRIGFAWARYDVADADLADLAGRLASALHHAYDEGGGRASGACSPSGAYTWCQCEVARASFNPGWSTFDTW